MRKGTVELYTRGAAYLLTGAAFVSLGTGCSSAADPQPRPEERSAAQATTCSTAASNGVHPDNMCGWGCTDTCTSQAIGEPGGPFYCDTPTSCGGWPWCPTATVVTGPLDSPQCECQCK